MRLAALAICLLSGCAVVPSADTPYFVATASGDNLYPATETRIYKNGQRVLIEAPHPSNNNQGQRTVSDAAGGFAFGLAAINDPDIKNQSSSTSIVGPDDCCHVFVARSYAYFDGDTLTVVPETVWRQAAGIPPFVDEPILAN